MLRKLVGCACILLLAAPLTANATQVYWNITGHLTTVVQPPPPSPCGGLGQDPCNANDFPSQITVNNPFNIVLGFNTAALLTASNGGLCASGNPCSDSVTGGTAARYQSTSVSMLLTFGTSGNTLSRLFAFDTGNPSCWGGANVVRDNYTFGSDVVDGVSFGLNSFCNGDGEGINLGLIFRGTDLSLLSSSALPGAPPPGLASLPTRVFQVCVYNVQNGPAGCPGGFFDGQVDSVTSVPEPGSLALLGLGLAGLGLSRRRRAS